MACLGRRGRLRCCASVPLALGRTRSPSCERRGGPGSPTIVGQEPDKLDGYGRRVDGRLRAAIRPWKPHEVEGRSCACLARPEPTRRLGLSRRLAWPPWKQSQPVPPPLSLSVQLCRSTSPEGVWRVDPESVEVGGGGAARRPSAKPPITISPRTIRAKYDWSVVLQPLARVLGSDSMTSPVVEVLLSTFNAGDYLRPLLDECAKPRRCAGEAERPGRWLDRRHGRRTAADRQKGRHPGRGREPPQVPGAAT